MRKSAGPNCIITPPAQHFANELGHLAFALRLTQSIPVVVIEEMETGSIQSYFDCRK